METLNKKQNIKLYFPSIIGFDKKKLDQIILDIDKYYNEWKIVKTDKKTGKPKTYLDGVEKERFIRPSLDSLKVIQKRIKNRILDTIDLPNCVYGGVKGRCNISNAKVHQGNKYIFTTDLQSFFPSIKPNIVYDALIKLGYNKQFAYYVMRFVTWKGEIPQGASTSTSIANIIFLDIDLMYEELAKKYKLTYTRFVDDLTFSAQYDFQEIIPEILRVISDSCFTLSRRKTQYGSKQVVTGVQVFNNKIDVSPEILNKVEEEKLLNEELRYRTKYRNRVLSTNKKR